MKFKIKIVLTLRQFTLFFLTSIGILLSFQFSTKPRNPSGLVKDYYLTHLSDFHSKAKNLAGAASTQASLETVKEKFLFLRLAYKKVAILSEYYHIYETRLLNGPALPWVQDDNPAVIEPTGMQVIEEAIFEKDNPIDYALIIKEISGISEVIKVLLKEKNLEHSFSPQLVFESLHYSLIRTMTTGLTGFDSPVSLHSIPETISSLEGWIAILSFYKNEMDANMPGHFQKITELIEKSKKQLSNEKEFTKLDRLSLIKNILSPAYTLFTEAAVKNGLLQQSERKPINLQAPSFFSPSIFNINSFSPTKRYWMSKDRIDLGKKLFSDPILSVVKNRTCASCHKPEKAFTDGTKTALSVDGETFLLRNTPTLWNSALQTRQFYDSRTSVLENQLSDVVHNQKEMKGSLKESVNVLKSHPAYAAAFAKAYNNESEQIHPYTIANAISSYVRSLVALNSRFDQYMRGNEKKMNSSEKRGFNLFMGKAKCGTCHFMPLFNGLIPPGFSETESEVLGVPSTTDTISPVLDKDKGKINFTGASIHAFAFKTPTLRNVALTAPYMHNGVYETLEEVMDFYNKGGGTGLGIAPPNQTLPPDKLNLSKSEIRDVIAFMKTLNDTKVSNNLFR